MTEFDRVVKKTIRFMAVVWLVGSLVLWLGGMTDRLIGFQIGALVGVVYGISLVLRLRRICVQDAKQAVREMQINTMARVILTFLALLLTAKLSFAALQGAIIAIGVMFVGRLFVVISESRLE